MRNSWKLSQHGRCTAIAVCGAAVLLAGNVLAGGFAVIMLGDETVAASDQEWKESMTIPPGVKMIMILGNPKQTGPYVFRVKFPAGYELPAHKHPDRRSVTVLQGHYWSGAGEKFDREGLARFGPGSFYVTEPGVPHFAWAEDEVIIQEMGMGPVDNPIEYMNPADDPRRERSSPAQR
jgi:quercetin dioxygenase-like cupin family protein